jgi:hypothetical protein
MHHLVGLQEILCVVDEQMCLWDSLHQHSLQYVEAINSCLERRNGLRNANLGGVNHMHNLALNLELDLEKSLKSLITALISTLQKCFKVQKTIQTQSKLKDTHIEVNRITDHQNPQSNLSSLLDQMNELAKPGISDVRELLDRIATAYSLEYTNLMNITQQLLETQDDQTRTTLVEQYKQQNSVSKVRSSLLEYGIF